MAVLFTKTTLYVYTMYAETFDDQLQSLQQANPMKVNDTNYYMNRIKLRVAINDAQNAVVDMDSIGNSQAACDRATFLRENTSLFY